MSEGGVGACPQVSVVDSQARYIKMPPERKPRWASQLQNFLLLLVGLAMLGIIVEGFLIYRLYQRTEVFSISNHQNMSENPPYRNPEKLLGQVIDKKRPFAHLLGPNRPVGTDEVVQWANEGDAITQHMKYKEGRLTVEEDGYYYIYSKVIMNVKEECSLSQHKIMKKTKAYDDPLELMQSKNLHCSTSKPRSKAPEASEDLWNSYLAGIFELRAGDDIYVTLKNITKLRPGPKSNFMGAFMVSP